ncbi:MULTISPECIES: hypothetical protein [Myxococcus]|uniref:hypothetical protein n=1 Tax=Myxococcus TaxID=32 RepID=UPI0013D016E3|nr:MULTISPECIES: hypothetical protein [Myxococcus]NVJ21122.1 hypothetical protein [Myxococcus sp. AM011]
MKKKLLAVCMVLGMPFGFAMGMMSSPSEAEASGGYVCLTEYYSDDTYSQQVGTEGCGCWTPCKLFGQRTEYAVRECTPC